MSVYTTIYPDKAEFPETDKAKLEREMTFLGDRMAEAWSNIVALCASTPKDITPSGEVPYRYIVKEFNEQWDDYIRFFRKQSQDSFNVEYLESEEYIKEHPEWEDKRPWLEWNHFDYSSDPEEGFRYTSDAVTKVYNELKAFACATPSDVFKIDDDTPIVDYVASELDNKKEWLDENLSERAFCKLLKKYWSTHEVG